MPKTSRSKRASTRVLTSQTCSPRSGLPPTWGKGAPARLGRPATLPFVCGGGGGCKDAPCLRGQRCTAELPPPACLTLSGPHNASGPDRGRGPRLVPFLTAPRRALGGRVAALGLQGATKHSQGLGAPLPRANRAKRKGSAVAERQANDGDCRTGSQVSWQ